MHQTMLELEAEVEFGGRGKITSVMVEGRNAVAEIEDGLIRQKSARYHIMMF